MHIDPRYAIDIDTLRDWQRAEWLIAQGDLPMVLPGHHQTPPAQIQVDLLVFDFDGVMTDDRVWVDQDGHESVAANRGDGLGIAMLRKAGIPMLVLSTETKSGCGSPLPQAGAACIQGVGDKADGVAIHYWKNASSTRQQVVYLGNDINDLPCFPLVGCAVVVADAHPDVIAQADLVLDP